MIAFIVDRLHVSTSDMDVLRTVRKRLDRKVRRDPSKRRLRKWAYREALKRHKANRELYNVVTRGI